MSRRAAFEAAVIERMKESGFLEVEIRVECLGRSGEGYADGSIDAYWDFFQAGAASVVVELPEYEETPDSGLLCETAVREAIEAAGGTVKS